jgi:hypothetical protein
MGVAMAAVISVRMSMVMGMLVLVAVLMIMCFCMGGAGVFEPESGDGVADDPSEGAELLERIANSVFHIGGEREQ